MGGPLSLNPVNVGPVIGPLTFRRRERERTRPFTRPIFPVWRKMVWERD